MERAGVFRFMSKSWSIRRSRLLTADLSVDPGSREELQEILQNELRQCDGFHESRNNWLSIRFSVLGSVSAPCLRRIPVLASMARHALPVARRAGGHEKAANSSTAISAG